MLQHIKALLDRKREEEKEKSTMLNKLDHMESVLDELDGMIARDEQGEHQAAYLSRLNKMKAQSEMYRHRIEQARDAIKLKDMERANCIVEVMTHMSNTLHDDATRIEKQKEEEHEIARCKK